MIQEKKRKVDMVLTETNLPDICAFMFVQILETEFNLPVIMICESYHPPTILRGLLNGAMYCLSKPLRLEDVKELWQHHLIKKTEIQEGESSASGATDNESGIQEENKIEVKLEPSESLGTGNSSQSRKRKIEVEGSSSIGLPPEFIWTPYIHDRFLDVVCELGVNDATPSEVLRRISAPGLTIETVIEKLQEYKLFLKRQEQIPLMRDAFFPDPTSIIAHQQPYGACRLMGQDINTSYYGGFPVIGVQQNPPQDDDDQEKPFFEWLKEMGAYPDPYPRFCEIMASAAAAGRVLRLTEILDLMSQPPSAPMPVANGAQRFVQPSWSTTVTEVPPVTFTPPPSPIRRRYARENGYQVQGPPGSSRSLGRSSFPPSSSMLQGNGGGVSSFPDEIFNDMPEKSSD